MRGTWQTTDSGGGGRIALVVLAVILGAAVAGPVANAAATIAAAVTVVVIVVACVAGLAALAGLALVAVRVRRRIMGGPRAVPYRVTVAIPGTRQAAELPEPAAQALPAARDDVSALPRVHVDPHVVTSRTTLPRCPRRAGRWS